MPIVRTAPGLKAACKSAPHSSIKYISIHIRYNEPRYLPPCAWFAAHCRHSCRKTLIAAEVILHIGERVSTIGIVSQPPSKHKACLQVISEQKASAAKRIESSASTDHRMGYERLPAHRSASYIYVCSANGEHMQLAKHGDG
jgi:hypothetical protein